jgi:uncharacterized membrane protein HdeD (DUF308 family)
MNKEKKDLFYAKLSFVLGLGFWIPLLNFPFSILAIITGIAALKLAHKHPERYGGRTYAVIGIILGTIPILLGISMLLIPTTRTIMLENLLGQNLTSIIKR